MDLKPWTETGKFYRDFGYTERNFSQAELKLGAYVSMLSNPDNGQTLLISYNPANKLVSVTRMETKEFSARYAEFQAQAEEHLRNPSGPVPSLSLATSRGNTFSFSAARDIDPSDKAKFPTLESLLREKSAATQIVLEVPKASKLKQ